MGFAALRIGHPGLAGGAETTGSELEVLEDVLHERCLGREVCSAAVEVAGEGLAGAHTALGFHCTTGSDDCVLLAAHALVEEVWVLCAHLGNGRHDRGHVRVLLWALSTGTRAHMAVLCTPVLEPVGANGAAGATRGNLVEVKFDDKIAKRVEDVGASLLAAGEDILAWRGVVDGDSAIVRFHILRLVAGESLAGHELCGGKHVLLRVRDTARIVVEDCVLLRTSGGTRVGSVGRWRSVVGHVVRVLSREGVVDTETLRLQATRGGEERRRG